MVKTAGIALVLALGCGKSDTKPHEPPPAAKPADKPKDAPPPAPAGPSKLTVHIKMPAGEEATVKLEVPGAFVQTAWGAVARNSAGEAESGVELSITCDGDCSKAKDNLAKLVAHAPQGEAIPNVNTGKPELDAVRLDVATVDTGDLTDGKS